METAAVLCNKRGRVLLFAAILEKAPTKAISTESHHCCFVVIRPAPLDAPDINTRPRARQKYTAIYQPYIIFTQQGHPGRGGLPRRGVRADARCGDRHRGHVDKRVCAKSGQPAEHCIGLV